MLLSSPFLVHDVSFFVIIADCVFFLPHFLLFWICQFYAFFLFISNVNLVCEGSVCYLKKTRLYGYHIMSLRISLVSLAQYSASS